ncbi:ABC transporter ATP-binding protein, partial [Pseudomonas aeruginosa]|nr:ABC transporter ATP-binding protein [Pseudomonas aeruginosa]
MSKVILKVESLVKDFTIRHNHGGMKHKLAGLFNPRFRERIETLRAVNDVSFTLCKGESLSLIGHNGSGK